MYSRAEQIVAGREGEAAAEGMDANSGNSLQVTSNPNDQYVNP